MIRRTFPRNPRKREKATHFVFRSVQNVDWIVDSAPVGITGCCPLGNASCGRVELSRLNELLALVDFYTSLLARGLFQGRGIFNAHTPVLQGTCLFRLMRRI